MLTKPTTFLETSDKASHIWGKTSQVILRFNSPQHKWASKLYEQMRNNFWIPQRINLTQDSLDYPLLTSQETRAFKGVLAFLVFLDSIQTTNLHELNRPVTAPEIKLCLTEQASQEFLHSQSYQFLIDSVIPVCEREEIYQLCLTDKHLKSRCSFISELFQGYIDKPTEENYLISLVADYILEGLYFYSGFNLFYTLSLRGLMGGTTDMVKLIHRDELTHVTLFLKLVKEARQELSLNSRYFDTLITDIFMEAYQAEVSWNQYIIGDRVLGLSNKSNTQFVQYLTDKRLKNLGLSTQFDNVTNPYKHLEKISDLTHLATSKANFFESGVTSYVQATSIDNWEF
jgi:ribonucleoside-diphosphate reductase beta chain